MPIAAQSSTISRPTVPCPAMTWRRRRGGRRRRPARRPRARRWRRGRRWRGRRGRRVAPLRSVPRPLHRRRVGRHDDGRAGRRTGAPPRRRPGHGCRRRRRRRPCARLAVEAGQRVVGAAELERAGALQALALRKTRPPAAHRGAGSRAAACARRGRQGGRRRRGHRRGRDGGAVMTDPRIRRATRNPVGRRAGSARGRRCWRGTAAEAPQVGRDGEGRGTARAGCRERASAAEPEDRRRGRRLGAEPITSIGPGPG